MNETDSLREDFEREMEKIKTEPFLSSEYKRKKLLIWIIRTAIAIGLYIVFWEYQWVRWSLVIYAPLSVFSLASIYGWNYLINRKLRSTEEKIKAAEEAIRESEEE